MTQPSEPDIRSFFDPETNTVTHLVIDPVTREAAVIDPVLDFDPRSGQVDTSSVRAVLDAASAAGARIVRVLETHAHADHLSAAPFVKAATGAPVGIGAHIRDVQAIFRPVFDARDVVPDGRAFDTLFEDGDRFVVGALTVEVMHVPGHTPADLAYRIGQDVFVGDTLFMPDYGTARADFPGGNARSLYRSIRRLLDLPGETRLHLCHDYKAEGRETFVWRTTVAEQRAGNIHVHDGVTEDDFVAMRQARDATLAPPTLLLASIQVNIRAGHFPPARPDGTHVLVTPVRAAPGVDLSPAG